MILYIVSLISGFNFLLLSLVLFLKPSPYKERNRYLAFIFLFSGIYEGLNNYFNYFVINDVNYLQYYVSVEIVLMMCCAPLVYFYTLSITTGRVKIKLRTAIHLVPLIPVIIFELHLALLPAQERIDYLVNNYHELYLEVALENIWFYFQLIFYFSLSLRKLYSFRKKLAPNQIAKYSKETAWFKNYLVLILSLLVLSFPVSVFANNDKTYIVAGQVIMNIQFIYVFFHVLWNSHLFPSNIDYNSIKEKYAGSALSEQQIDDYYQRIMDYLKTNKPYINSELTLNRLAKALRMSPHYLSQVINTKTGSNFFDFVNKLRVEESIELLQSIEFKNHSVEAIAFEVGFGNKASFNRAFKKFTDKTPSQFRGNY